MLWLNDTARIRVSKIVNVKEKFATVFASSSAKKQGSSSDYEYSNWTVTFVGTARKAFELVSEGSILTLTKAGVTNVPYQDKEGETVYKNVKVIVFDFEVYRNGTGASEPVTPDDDSDIPF